MTVAVSDIRLVKSATVTDTGANGGRSSATQIVAGALNNILPLVTPAERLAGITRWRKVFTQNRNAEVTPEIASLVTAYMTNKSNAGDRQFLVLGTARDTQATVSAGNPLPVACGKLSTALSGGETSVSAVFESAEAGFVPGGKLFVSSQYKASQTIAAGVKAGDSVVLTTGTWQKADFTTDITYPKGRYIGNFEVQTDESGVSDYEFITLPTGKTENEVIGTGNGTTTPTLSTLAAITNGVNPFDGYRPVISVTVSGTTQTVTVNADGSCSGFCSAGQLNMTTGAWTTPITFSQAPTNATDITCTYYNKFWSWSGNTCTITTSGQVANAYATANTYVAGCLPELAEMVATSDSFTDASNIYDSATYPVLCRNSGAVEDDWTITMTSTTAFSCTGLFSGSVGTGSISSDFSPVNPATGTPFFTLDKDGWEGSPAIGNQLTFTTHVGEYSVWLKQIVPAETESSEANLAGFELFWIQ